MNTKEAIQFLEKKGFKVYTRGNDFLIWIGKNHNFICSARKLIGIATGYQTPGKSNGHKADGKFVVGPGGTQCPCCTVGPMNYVKTKTHRRERRKNRQNLQKILDE